MTGSIGPSMSVLDAIYKRRAIRSYTPQKVDRETLSALLAAAVQAPTAMHEEPWAFSIVQDKTLLARYSDRAKAMLVGETKQHGLVRSGDTKAPSHLELLADPAFNIFYDAGTLVVISGKGTGPYVAADCWLGAENFMRAACAMGLGTCCIGFAVPLLNTSNVKAELSIPSDATAIAPIIVGHPSHIVPPVPRKPPAVLCWR